ncbi:NADH-quinone oxidoreductase subunit NuoF [Thalassotalea sp. Y01]|uniref:NADH-quinone oxidoreductase subunit NuoF n=1 Tax=Thalassotalea sp. Y01 TaxID=2729613 RepID=UPI00145D30C6|nr:NADH-quinone oxidoreductase subunit NuoF [Thalassotalea sp. Y01]NMP16833.1 NADH-quinone oxidoreductase subunit NuoF [Thalassotalea sp. Y01]
MTQPINTPLTAHVNLLSPPDYQRYVDSGGFVGAKNALAMNQSDCLGQVKDSELKGRGGAGFPTGMKWSFVPMGDGAPERKYLICNADEMEPGTFKDRLLLEGNPLQLVEAMLIASYTIGANQAFIFLRGEYHLAAQRIQAAIDEVKSQGWLGNNIQGSGYQLELYLHTSAGRYICGEETALINALEGRRANPRAKPPFPQVSGLFGKPTIVNNVETLCNLPHIFAHGGQWFKELSGDSDAGTKIYGASGRLKNPGLWEMPFGKTLREVLYLNAGGLQDGLKFRGLLPGGASTDFLVEQHLDVAMDYDSIAKAGSRLGTAGLIVLDDHNCPVGMVRNLLQFFAQESCGFCTPCRDGTPWAVELLTRIEHGHGTMQDIDALDRLCDFMWIGKTHCALAPGAVEPLRSALKYFRDDFVEHVEKGCCAIAQGKRPGTLGLTGQRLTNAADTHAQQGASHDGK